jgi:uncharacterized protein YkwD
VPIPRNLSVVLLSILSCGALLVAPASSTAATPKSSAPRATLAKSARAGCAKLSTRAARRACRAHARTQRIKPTTRSHTPKPRPARQPRTKTVAPTQPASEQTSAVTQPAPVDRAAATIAAVLAAPCQNTELTPEAANIGLVREAVLCLINRKRAENDESPLTASPQLQAAAESHCEELIADDYFAHISPSGETPVDRIRDTGYIPGPSVGYVIGENLAWGTYQLSTPQAIVAAWIASPGHLANILEAQYRETGIAITPAVPETVAPGANGATYAQEFGVIIP